MNSLFFKVLFLSTFYYRVTEANTSYINYLIERCGDLNYCIDAVNEANDRYGQTTEFFIALRSQNWSVVDGREIWPLIEVPLMPVMTPRE